MKRLMQIRRHLLAVFGVLGLALLAMAMPYFVSHDRSEVVLNTSTVMAADQHHYRVTAPVALFGGPYVVVESGTIALSERSQRAAQGAGSADKIIMSGDAQLTLSDGRIAVNLAGVGPEAADAAPASLFAPLAAALASMQFSSLALSDCTIVLHSDRETVQELRGVEALVKLASRDTLAVTGTFWLRGEKLSFRTSLNIGNHARLERRLPIQAKITGNLIDTTLRGHLSVGNRARLIAPNSELKFSDLGKAARWLNIGWPARSAIEAFSATGLIDWSAGILVFQDAVFKFDGNRATGAMSVNYQSPRPQVDGTLAFDELNLTGLLVQDDVREESLIEATMRKSSNWLPARLGLSGEAITMPLLRDVDADLRLSAERVQIGSLVLGRSATAVSLRDGKMLADLAELEFEGGGQGTVQISLDATEPDPKLGVRGRLEGFEVGNLATALFGGAVVTGRGDAIINVKATGDRYSDIMSTLSGRIEVRVLDGAALTLDLAKMVAEHSTGVAAPVGWGTTTGLTNLSEFDMRLAFTDGLALVETFSAKSGSQLVFGSGTIDVAAQNLDANIWIGAEAPTSNDETPMGDLIQFRGDWHAPGISVTRAPSRQAGRRDPDGRPADTPGRG
ncbi:AsmA-like C-terminal region-containing protein [Filomicrobium sp.]|uniref:AsmA family protein n=1 Tax=Filomicrobium sp. TaxID=2024831 RepID=UPI002588BE48|nr:AsmA-like C-terminal region-containing protein [Filomicrobium sp.]MCV0368354.1 AsmA family protein [Filomicrobium sp.]